MKVKNININSKRTKEAIRKSFAELLYEKHDLDKLTVTELVKRAGITRSSFYTHYESIYDVATEFQNDTTEILLKEDIEIKTLEDVYKYIDTLTEILKENEDIYRMLLASNEQQMFFERIRNTFVNKACIALKPINNSPYLELKMNFFMDGIISQITRHYKKNNYYTLNELNKNIKEWFKELFTN